MKTQFSLKNYIYESVIFDKGAGNPEHNYESLDLNGMHIIGNHEYPLRLNSDKGPIIGTATLNVIDGALLADLKSLRPLKNMYPNIGFQIQEEEIIDGIRYIKKMTLHHVSIGPGENVDASISPIDKPTRIEEEIIADEQSDYDAAL